MKPVKMEKVRLLLPKSQLEEVIAALHDLGMVEIATAEYAGLGQGKPLEKYDAVAEQLIRIRAIKRALAGETPVKARPQPMKIGEALEKARKLTLERELEALTTEKEKLRTRLALQTEQLRQIRLLERLGNIDFSKLRTKSLDYWIGRVNKKTGAEIEEEMRLQGATVLHAPINEQEELLLVMYRKGMLEEGWGKWNSHRIEVPAIVTVPAATSRKIEEEREGITHMLQEIAQRMGALAQQHYAAVVSIEKTLTLEADRAQIPFRFAASPRMIVIEGWIRVHEEDRLRKGLDGWNVDVQILPAGKELPPTDLENPKNASPFQFITERFSLPNAREIDPTMIYFITLPLLYGMIVGDVGYGILSYFIAGWIMRKFRNSPTMYNVGNIWRISALPTVIFGILFDEWFGMGHLHLLETLAQWGLPVALHAPLYLPFVHRVHELTALIGLTVIIGLLHLGLGFLLGAINEWHHNKKHAIAKLAWIWVETMGTLAAGGLLLGMFSPEIGTAGAIGVIMGAVVLFLTEGIVGILELPGLAGNVLSYARIAAIGVVGVALAEIINEVFLPLPSQGLLALLFFPLFVVLHTVNAFIAMFESLIQGGRLNIIEFRSKFLTGGGKPFEPFSYSYTE